MTTSCLNRKLQPRARDTSFVPDGEVDLVAFTLNRDGDAVLDLTDARNFVQAIPAGSQPVALVVTGDGDFYEGQAATDATVNLLRLSGVLQHIAVTGREAWHFRRPDGAPTVTIRGKLLLGT